MSSGMQRLVTNTRERAISNDLNRMQAFKDADISELLRYLAGVDGYADTYSGDTSSTYYPLANAIVVNGLLVTPINSTLSLTVNPGIILLNDPSPGSDDSMWRFVRDPGISVPGVLTIAGGSGSTRIDVVEAKLADTLLESSSRDIFDPSTGTFVPATVDKVRAARLTYRVRAGVPGGGFPGVLYDWVPLACISVSATATTLDDCILWDLRPLWKDLADKTFRNLRSVSRVRKFGQFVRKNGSALELFVHGEAEQEYYLRHGFAGNTTEPIDIWSSSGAGCIWSAALSSFNEYEPWYVWACYPGGLRNWRRYTATGSPRRPWGHPGILTLSSIAPTCQGWPVSSISLPTATGLGLSTLFATLVATGLNATMTSPSGIHPAPAMSDGDWVYPGWYDGPFNANRTIYPIDDPSPGSFDGSSSLYALLDNLYHPANAKTIRVRATRMFVAPSGFIGAEGEAHATLSFFMDTEIVWQAIDATVIQYDGSTIWQRVTFDVPLTPYKQDPSLPLFLRGLTINWKGYYLTSPPAVWTTPATTDHIEIIGWRMTP